MIIIIRTLSHVRLSKIKMAREAPPKKREVKEAYKKKKKRERPKKEKAPKK